MDKKNMPVSYEQFVTLLAECLRKKCDSSCQFQKYEDLKNNGTVKHFLLIRNRDTNVSPCICMDEFYPAYVSKRMELSDIAEAVYRIYTQNEVRCPADTSLFMDWNAVRHGIRCRLIHTEKNKILLSGVPHREIPDLSVVYYLQMSVTDSKEGIVHINNKHMGFWNTDERSLYSEAWKNMRTEEDAVFGGIMDVIGSALGVSQSENTRTLGRQIYVLTNKSRLYGAVHMTDPEKMAEIAGNLDSDLWILPSSIHEVILIPCSFTDDADVLADMVCEMNKTELSAEEILSCHVYYYSRNAAGIRIAA